jgi:hypothetical protein
MIRSIIQSVPATVIAILRDRCVANDGVTSLLHPFSLPALGNQPGKHFANWLTTMTQMPGTGELEQRTQHYEPSYSQSSTSSSDRFLRSMRCSLIGG